MTVRGVVEGASRRQAFLLLRYTLIIAMAYLLLVEHEFASPPTGLLLAIVAALASNVVIAQLPQRFTDSTFFYGAIIVADTLWITVALVSSGLFGPEFFYLYFFVLFLAGVGENLALIAVGAFVVSLAYILVLSTTGGFPSLWNSRFLIRIPFLFTAAVFYGYLVDRVRRERQRAREQSDTVAHLEEMRQNLADRAAQLEQINTELEHEIAERKRAEEQLGTLSLAVEQSPSIVIITDADGHIEYVNPKFTEITGYNLEEVTGQNPRILRSGEVLPGVYQRLWETITSGGEWRGELLNKRKNGELYWTSVSISPITNSEGVIAHFVGVQEDITERKRAEQTRESLYRASLTIQESLALEERLNRVLTAAQTLLELDRVNILLADRDGRWLQGVASIGTDEPPRSIRVPIAPDGGAIAQAYLTRKRIVWDGRESVPQEFRLAPPYDQIRALRSRAFVNLPLVAEGRAIGVLGADRKHSRRPLEPATIELLQLFATQAAIAIASGRLFEDMESTNRRLLALNRVAQAVNQSLNVRETLEAALDATLEAVDLEAGNIRLWNEQEGVLVMAAYRGMSEWYINQRRYFKPGEGVAGKVYERGEALVVEDMEQFPHLNEMAHRDGVRSVVSIPIRSRDKIVGVMSTLSYGQRRFTPPEIDLLTAIGNQIGTALENARLFEAIAQGKQEWESTFDAIADGIALLDEQGRIARANRAFGSWWENPLEVFIKAPWHDLWDRLGISLPCPHCDAWRRKQPVFAEAHLPAANRFMALAAFPLETQEPGTPAALTGTILVMRDITERKRAEQELRIMQLQLIQTAKFESVGQLAAGVAHEVKNPLAIIQQGLTYLAHASSSADDGKTPLVLEKMENAVRRADRVIGGLLDFSTPREVDGILTDLNGVVEQSLQLVKHELIRAHVTVLKELGKDLPPLKLDRHKIEQVFVNLFMNAIQAMPEGGTLTVRTVVKQLAELPADGVHRTADTFRAGETLVAVQVEDTGTGIPVDKLDRVFDPFFTTKAVGQGTGLGLSVTRKIIELHGGMIKITNRQEGGVQVTLTFKTEEGHGDAEELSIKRKGGTRRA